MRTLILLAAALVASPASAQSWGWYAGPTLGWHDVFEDPRVGLNGGMSLQEFDGYPHLRIDLRFVQRGCDCGGLALSLQMPVLYTTHFSETGYVFVGPAAGYSYYDEHIWDLSAVMGIGSMLARAGSKAIAWEASYSISLPAYWGSYYGIETGSPLQGLSLNLMFR